jgi:hypothetical protein
MINAMIVLTGLLVAVGVGFLGLVRLRFAVALVLACMVLNLFGCSTARAQVLASPVQEAWTISCPMGQYLTSDGSCATPTLAGIAPQFKYAAPSEWLRFSLREMRNAALAAWALGFMTGIGVGILMARRGRA